MVFATVVVDELANAAPTEALVAALRREETEVKISREGQALPVHDIVLRVTPHRDADACGHRGPHAAYFLTWSIATLCPYRTRHTRLSVHERQLVARSCGHCAYELGLAHLAPGHHYFHLAWWDLSTPVTLRPEPVPADELERATDVANSYAKCVNREPKAPERYRWREFTDAMFDWEEANPKPTLTAEQDLGLEGVRRHVLQRQVDDSDATLRTLLARAHAAGLGATRLSELSGISRRTVPAWAGS
ncbi:hypothetical protein [Streptodolium elevatio]